MATVKQGLYVVVWEWENKQRRWRPYPPEVTQQLERAHSKNLRSVFLGDSDPSLNNYSVNLSTMQQECKVTKEIVNVRRNFYPQGSPAGQGAVWQWAGDTPGDWHVYDMCVQCIIEESWATGAQTVDLSETFPMCPYVINFCNLTQINSRTKFTRFIRRIQQAAYPVGKPPMTPQQSHHHQGTSSSSSSGNSINKARPGTSSGTERARRRGSRGDDDVAMMDPKPRNFLNKMFGRGNSGNSGLNCNKGSMSPNSDHNNGRAGVNSWNGSVSASPPKPMPRTTISPVASNPPVPKPRTSVPHAKPVQQQQFHTQHQSQHAQHHPQNHQHHHQQHHIHHPSHPQKHQQQQLQVGQHRPSHQYQDDREEWVNMPRGLRSDSGVGRFGSNHTLDSDCSSLQSGRRPSLDTISTYLSQDSYIVEDDVSQGTRFYNQDEHKFVEDLIQVGVEENMDDDVFDEDEEVREVMRVGAGRVSPTLMPSASPPTRPQHYRQRQMSHNHVSSPNDLSHRQVPSQQHCQFMPIAAANNGSDLSPQQNGVKRKRTGERATPGHPRMGDGDDEDSQDMLGFGNHNQHRHQKGHYGSRAPIAAEDRLLVQYTQSVDSPPDETCSICMWSLQESSGFSDDDIEGASNATHSGGVRRYGVVSLVLCGHLFHQACVREMAKSSAHFLECPNCKTLHGEKLGTQPDGNMSVSIVSRSLPGYSECNTIQIIYNIHDGIQGPEHPYPGRPYRAIGFPRTAYLPNNAKGNKVLKLLREAWRRRLIFTIGTSVTTGLPDAVTWNEIHHKTEWNNYSGHGYPDPNYLDNVLFELATHGVTETTLV